jgi:hypothetical protein
MFHDDVRKIGGYGQEIVGAVGQLVFLFRPRLRLLAIWRAVNSK